jgi:chromosome segregation ATPase
VIEPAPGQMRQLLRLRRMRLDASEQAMRAARQALLAAESTLNEGRTVRQRWVGASAEFEGWVRSATERLHRLLPMLEARRAEFARGLREVDEYIAWWQGKVEEARADLARAQAAWVRERARFEALESRHLEMERRRAVLVSEAQAEEQADARAALLTARRAS